MGKTIIEKIIGSHSGQEVRPGDIVDVAIDVRAARDFGGANVVKNLRDHALPVLDPSRTVFTFDCNPTGSDQKYAANQHLCRQFAREWGMPIYDIDAGIGTHLAIDEGLVVPGSTFVSTDSHANILGAIGAFGQGMGDVDIAQAFAFGKVWFKVPPSVKVILRGEPSPWATAKDITLALLRRFGADGLLGYSAEIYGEAADRLSLSGRITVSSMATEMGAIIAFFPPSVEVLDYCGRASGREVQGVYADPDAAYDDVIELEVEGLEPLISRPGHPEDVVEVKEVAGRPVDSVFIGSCTNGRLEDLQQAAEILRDRKVAPGVVLKIVPATDALWRKAMETGLLGVFKEARALVSNAGCGGCAAGQVGQNGPGEVTVSTGNRNFAGKQGGGEVYLASPAVAAASAVAGEITLPQELPSRAMVFLSGGLGSRGYRSEGAVPGVAGGGAGWVGPGKSPAAAASSVPGEPSPPGAGELLPRPTKLRGRVWVIPRDNIDTDMIFHNRYLAITNKKEMGRYTFDNLAGWEDFAGKAKPGDIVVTGKNFGAGSSRQQAVDCFESLGVAAIIAESFGAIYERNAINQGFPVVRANLLQEGLADGDEIEVDLEGQTVAIPSGKVVRAGFSPVQLEIYRRGGLLAAR